MPEYVQLSLYPDPDEHFAYVAVDELPWPQEGICYFVRCPAADCVRSEGHRYETFQAAYDIALAHRRAWLPEWLLSDLGEG